MVQNDAHVWDGFDSGEYHGANYNLWKFPRSKVLWEKIGKNLHFLQFFFSSLSQQPHAQVLLHSIRAKFCAHLNGIQGR